MGNAISRNGVAINFAEHRASYSRHMEIAKTKRMYGHFYAAGRENVIAAEDAMMIQRNELKLNAVDVAYDNFSKAAKSFSPQNSWKVYEEMAQISQRFEYGELRVHQAASNAVAALMDIKEYDQAERIIKTYGILSEMFDCNCPGRSLERFQCLLRKPDVPK